MSQTIWKFPLQFADEQEVNLRRGAQVLSVGLDPQGQLCLWAQVNPENIARLVRARIVGTGNSMPDMQGFRFVGSVLEGPFMWHVFVEAHA